MKYCLLFLLLTIAFVSLSCGTENAPARKNEQGSKTSTQIKPLTDTKTVEENSEAKSDNASGPGNLDPCSTPLTGDFDITCPNGVRVIRKNGELKTIFPDGEVYYTPEQIL